LFRGRVGGRIRNNGRKRGRSKSFRIEEEKKIDKKGVTKPKVAGNQKNWVGGHWG